MEKKFLAIEIQGEVFVMEDLEEVRLPLRSIQHRIIGEVCTQECNVTCAHFRSGTCPFSIMRNLHGQLIHVLKKE